MTTVISTTVGTQTISSSTPLLVTQNGLVTGMIGFSIGSDPGTLIVAGTVQSDGGSAAIATNGDDQITVALGGLVYGGATSTEGIRLQGSNDTLTVHGTVIGRDGGVLVSGFGADTKIYLSASGLIEGGSNGNGLDSGGYSAAIANFAVSGLLEITNAGTILGRFNPDNNQTIAILQADTADGSEVGYNLALDAEAVVKNSGTIIGDVLLGGGDDTYDGTGGGTVDGILDLGTGNDTLIGGSAAEIASGGGAADTLLGRGGEDVLRGDGGGDLMRGGRDDDRLIGGSGNDQIYGNGDNDELLGGANNDMLHGGTGDDTLDGGSGNDVIIGGRGDDMLTGGGATDTFVFKGNFGSDVILDFAASDDEDIDLSGVLNIRNWTDLQTNHLSNSNKGAVIDAGNGNEILLAGFDASNLQSGDFIF